MTPLKAGIIVTAVVASLLIVMLTGAGAFYAVTNLSPDGWHTQDHGRGEGMRNAVWNEDCPRQRDGDGFHHGQDLDRLGSGRNSNTEASCAR